MAASEEIRLSAHVWAIAGPLVVTIAGDADGKELTRIAESLKPQA